MKQEWFTAKELVGINGLPSTPQGINAMARRENWIKRRRSGVQGRAVEYHIQNLPGMAVNVLAMQEEASEYAVQRKDPLSIWIESYHQLTESERQKLITLIMREGIVGMMKKLEETSE